VDRLASEMAREGRAHQEGLGAVGRIEAAAPTKRGATLPLEGVVATAVMEEEVEQGDNMEGVEWEGLFGSKHTPAPGEPVPSMPPGPMTEEKEKKGKEKGKGKAVQIVASPAMGRIV